MPRYTPPGSVPVDRRRADWSAEWTTGKAATADALRNPFAPGAAAGPGAAPPGPDVPVIPRDSTRRATRSTRPTAPSATARPATRRARCRPGSGAPSLLTGRARGVHRRLPLQHHPLRPGRHAPLRRQGVPAQRPLGDREPRPEAAGPDAARPSPRARPRRSRRRRARPDRPERDPDESPRSTSASSSARSPAGTTSSSASAAGCAILGLILFVRRSRRGQARPRLAPVPRQLALLHRPRRRQRGVRGGAEDHQRQVVGADHPVRRGVGRLPAGLAPRPAADLHRRVSRRSTAHG